MKYNPFSWFFTRPQGKLGRKVMGYYWRTVVLGLVGFFFLFPHLMANYPQFFTPQIGAPEVPWPVIAIASVAALAFSALIFSLPIQFIRLITFIFDVYNPCSSEAKERQRRLTEVALREKRLNHINLSVADSATFSRIRLVNITAAALSVCVVFLILVVLPPLFSENVTWPWVIFADLIRELERNSLVVWGLLLTVIANAASIFYERKVERLLKAHPDWINGVENRPILTK